MFKKVLGSFLLAFHNIRSHFFHTILSILGIVIGVASLVSILSLIDGMEEFAREQITKTTSLKSISIQADTYHRVNGVRMKKDTFFVIDFANYKTVHDSLSKPALIHLRSSFSTTLTRPGNDTVFGAICHGVADASLPDGITLSTGKVFSDDEIAQGRGVAVINTKLASTLDSTKALDYWTGKQLSVRNITATITGVLEDKGNEPRLMIPITLLTKEELYNNPPELVVEANLIEDVPALKGEITSWLRARYPGHAGDFSIFTNDARVEQAAKGFNLFRIIMGLIVGISVVVGGIGIMNVLLISITERTVEIGIRKAVGANRRDIVLQFLAESITVSALGSAVGLLLGVAGTMAVVPIVERITEIPFRATFTLNTLIVTAILALLLGVVFGTYPAVRASRLDPVEAIRRE